MLPSSMRFLSGRRPFDKGENMNWSPFNVFIIALMAGIGWTIGAGLVNFIIARLAR